MGRSIVVSLVLLVVLGAGIGAILSTPVGAQRADDESAAAATSRYRVTALRVSVPEGATGAAMSLADFGREIPGALVARSGAPGLEGQFAAVPSQDDLLHLLSRRGTAAEVIFAGETETKSGVKATLISGQKMPIATVEVRGSQSVVTTRYEMTGIKVEVEPMPGDLHNFTAELTGVTAWTKGFLPVIFEFASKGRFTLPDGYTLVLSFLDRVDGAVFSHSVQSLAGGRSAPQDVPPDVVAQYFLLITRMDLE